MTALDHFPPTYAAYARRVAADLVARLNAGEVLTHHHRQSVYNLACDRLKVASVSKWAWGVGKGSRQACLSLADELHWLGAAHRWVEGEVEKGWLARKGVAR